MWVQTGNGEVALFYAKTLKGFVTADQVIFHTLFCHLINGILQ